MPCLTQHEIVTEEPAANPFGSFALAALPQVLASQPGELLSEQTSGSEFFRGLPRGIFAVSNERRFGEELDYEQSRDWNYSGAADRSGVPVVRYSRAEPSEAHRRLARCRDDGRLHGDR